MTIDEAIRHNEVTLAEMECQLLHHRASALRLSNEALKRVQLERRDSLSYSGELLLGETEEK